MKILDKLKVTIDKGKETDKVVLAEGKKVADSIADDLLMQSQIDLKEAKNSNKLKIITIWVDKGEAKKKVTKSTKKEATK